MTVTRITLDAAPEWLRRVDLRFQHAAIQGLWKAGARGVGVIVNEIIPSREPSPVDRGVYRAGWKTEKLDDGALIYNDEPHAVLIEDGVRPENVRIGRAMIEALSEWALRKGLAEDEEEATQAAWAIARAMQKRGIFNHYKEAGGLKILHELVDQKINPIIAEEVAKQCVKAWDL